MSGYSGTPLAKRLGIRAGARLYLHEPPAHYAQLLAPLPPDVLTVTRIDHGTDLIHAFASRRATLARLLQRARRAMRPDAALWVSWPKRASGVATDITEDVVRELALPLGLVDIKVCAVDAVWSGLKLMVRRSERAAPASARARR
jgi:hypothetical protein